MVHTNAAWFRAEEEYTDEVIGDDTLGRMFEQSAARNATRDAQWYKGGVYDRSLAPEVVPKAPDGEFASLTYEEMQEIVQKLAAGFRDLGVEAGDRVGIYAGTRMEWAQTDFALLSAGAVVTTVYTESSPSQVEYLLDDPGATGVVVENADFLRKILKVEDDLDLEFVVVIDELPDGSGPAGAARDRDDILTLADLYERGVDAFEPSAHERMLTEREPDDLASLVYTSGTTGKPKGVKLTHRNFRANVNGVRKRFAPRPDRDRDLPTLDTHTRTLSFLPLAHVFERTAGHFVTFASGVTVAYAESPDTIAEDIEKVRPTVGTSVPRVYERIFARMREQASGSRVRERVFQWAISVARDRARTDSPGIGLRAKYAVADKLVFEQVRKNLGGNVEMFISGGGSLSKRLAELFDGMGLPILEGYGLTETAPVVSVNPAENSRPGTLGPPLVDVDVKLDGDVVAKERHQDAGGEIGELLVKGPNVTEGYWNAPMATADVITDEGWFRTGDIVEVSDDDYLVYHDRLKQLLVLDTGKNVAPQPIEDEFATSERIEQVMVVGDDRKFVAAILVPNVEALRRWADNERLDLPDDRAEICEDERVREWVAEEVAAVNAELSESERIREFRLVPIEWTADNDLLTPSMKLKRRNILSRFDHLVEDIYGDEEA